MAVSCGTQGSTLEAKRGLPSLSRSRVRSVSLPRSRRVSSTGVGAAPSSTGTEGPKSSSCKRSEQCLPISRPSNLGAPGPEHRRVRPPTGNHDARGPRIGALPLDDGFYRDVGSMRWPLPLSIRGRGLCKHMDLLSREEWINSRAATPWAGCLAIASSHPLADRPHGGGPTSQWVLCDPRFIFPPILVYSFPSTARTPISPTSSPPSLPLPTIGVNVNQHARAVRNNAAPRKERVAWTPAAKDADAQDVGGARRCGWSAVGCPSAYTNAGKSRARRSHAAAQYERRRDNTEYGSVFEMEPAAKAKTQPNAWKSTSPACDLVVRYAGVLRAPVLPCGRIDRRTMEAQILAPIYATRARCASTSSGAAPATRYATQRTNSPSTRARPATRGREKSMVSASSFHPSSRRSASSPTASAVRTTVAKTGSCTSASIVPSPSPSS
ncbi:hypothetical protein K438DRAFT_1997066 [Mycena galopus ATCC 62051]|nr:hypothetical protein K438DRAFT_1997066 [Mycena galopus ATCC 62051]